MSVEAELHTRLTPYIQIAPRIAANGLRALSVSTSARVAHSKHAGNRHLSPVGIAENTRADLTKLAKRFALSERGVERDRAARKSDRAALEQKAFEQYRADAMGPEIRAALKALPHGAKIKLAAEDPRILGALVVVPPIVHGVVPQALESLVQSHLEKHHAADLKMLEAKDEAIVTAEASVRVARDTLYQVGGFPHGKALADWLYEHGNPSAADLEHEAAGRAVPGMPKFTAAESRDLTGFMSDVLEGLPK
jgi:hypothetical protein